MADSDKQPLRKPTIKGAPSKGAAPRKPNATGARPNGTAKNQENPGIFDLLDDASAKPRQKPGKRPPALPNREKITVPSLDFSEQQPFQENINKNIKERIAKRSDDFESEELSDSERALQQEIFDKADARKAKKPKKNKQSKDSATLLVGQRVRKEIASRTAITGFGGWYVLFAITLLCDLVIGGLSGFLALNSLFEFVPKNAPYIWFAYVWGFEFGSISFLLLTLLTVLGSLSVFFSFISFMRGSSSLNVMRKSLVLRILAGGLGAVCLYWGSQGQHIESAVMYGAVICGLYFIWLFFFSLSNRSLYTTQRPINWYNLSPALLSTEKKAFGKFLPTNGMSSVLYLFMTIAAVFSVYDLLSTSSIFFNKSMLFAGVLLGIDEAYVRINALSPHFFIAPHVPTNVIFWKLFFDDINAYFAPFFTLRSFFFIYIYVHCRQPGFWSRKLIGFMVLFSTLAFMADFLWTGVSVFGEALLGSGNNTNVDFASLVLLMTIKLIGFIASIWLLMSNYLSEYKGFVLKGLKETTLYFTQYMPAFMSDKSDASKSYVFRTWHEVATSYYSRATGGVKVLALVSVLYIALLCKKFVDVFYAYGKPLVNAETGLIDLIFALVLIAPLALCVVGYFIVTMRLLTAHKKAGRLALTVFTLHPLAYLATFALLLWLPFGQGVQYQIMLKNLNFGDLLTEFLIITFFNSIFIIYLTYSQRARYALGLLNPDKATDLDLSDEPWKYSLLPFAKKKELNDELETRGLEDMLGSVAGGESLLNIEDPYDKDLYDEGSYNEDLYDNDEDSDYNEEPAGRSAPSARERRSLSLVDDEAETPVRNRRNIPLVDEEAPARRRSIPLVDEEEKPVRGRNASLIDERVDESYDGGNYDETEEVARQNSVRNLAERYAHASMDSDSFDDEFSDADDGFAEDSSGDNSLEAGTSEEFDEYSGEQHYDDNDDGFANAFVDERGVTADDSDIFDSFLNDDALLDAEAAAREQRDSMIGNALFEAELGAKVRKK